MSMSTQTYHQREASNRAGELDLYRVFAACFGYPSRDRFAWFSGQEFRSLLKSLTELYGEPRNSRFALHFPNYSAYESAYIALFEVGVPGPPVPLLESANSHKSVPQDVVLECVNFYEVLGLRPSGSVFPADHLVTQLEFLATVRYLLEHQAGSEGAEPLRRLERDFIERHLLNWLPVAQEKINRIAPPLFPMLLRLLAAFARQELD
jgi:DMSO reductase family type II enzyme chaperone